MNKKLEILSKFETGDTPNGADFAELIEHAFNNEDALLKGQVKIDDLDIELQELINSKNPGGPSQNSYTTFIDPKSYGAKGDGVTDDSVAIQNAVNAIQESLQGGSGNLGGHTYTATSNKLVFSKGIYRITRTINLGRVHKIDFSNAIIKSETNDFAFDTRSYNAICEGGVFSGKKIFNVYNPNEDQGLIRFYNMEFKGCDVAFIVETQSSKVIISGSKFDDVTNPLIQIASDDMQFSDNWVQSKRNPENTKGNIISYGSKLTVKDSIFVPLNDFDSDESAWIEFNGRWLTVENNRFSGEVGNRCPLNWKTKFIKGSGLDMNGFYFKNNLIGHQSNQEKTSAVRLYNLPNHMYINNNYYGALTNYVLSFTDLLLSNLESDINEVKGYISNMSTGIYGEFSNDKYELFSYDVDKNNLYLDQKYGSDRNFIERQEDIFFLLNNYKVNVESMKGKQVYTVNKLHRYAQDITFMQPSYTSGNRIIRIPISGLERNVALKISVNWSNYDPQQNYNQVQEIIVFSSIDASGESFVRKLFYKNLIDSNMTTSTFGNNVQVGWYRNSDNTDNFTNDIPSNYSGISLLLPGSTVSVKSVTIMN